MLNIEPIKVPLTQGYFALISPDDAEEVLAYKWCASVGRGKRVVAMRSYRLGDKTVSVLMHRFVAKPMGLHVDHIDRNPLNNQRENLRLVTHPINRQNTSKQSNNTTGFKGVMVDRRSGKWFARIKAFGTTHYLGVHETPELAAQAYDVAAIRLLGPLASTNF